MPTKTKPRTKLQTIATSMRDTIDATDVTWLHRKLDNGLEVVLQRKVDETGAIRWRLAMARTAVEPSHDEITECREAFGVPVATEHETSSKSRTSPKSNITSTWYIAEMTWYEA